MAAYQAAKCHPNMKWLETVEAQEDNILSFNQADTLINKYGDELKGLFGMTSVATPGLGRSGDPGRPVRQDRGGRPRHAERDEALCRDGLREVGGAVEPGRSRLRRGHVLRAVADGKLKPGATSVKAGKLGELQVVNGSRDPARRAVHLHQGQHRRLRLLSGIRSFDGALVLRDRRTVTFWRRLCANRSSAPAVDLARSPND